MVVVVLVELVDVLDVVAVVNMVVVAKQNPKSLISEGVPSSASHAARAKKGGLHVTAQFIF